MRILIALASLPLIACFGGERASTGQCPAGETCSPKTPKGLQFIGDTFADQVLLAGPAPTAVGGTQDVALQYDRGDGILIALDLPYEADDDGGIGVKVDHTSGSVVTVRGAGSRTNYLRILDADDGTLFDRKELTGAEVDTIALVATDFEMIPDGADLVWATGDQTIGVALWGQVQEGSGPSSERLVDTSMVLDLAGADRASWDTLHLANAAAGTYSIGVTAGDKPTAPLDFEVVDQADAVQPIQPPQTIPANGTAQVCFEATNQGRYVVGLTWTYQVDGVTSTQSDLVRNCIDVVTNKTSGTIEVQASAGGQGATVTLAVGAMTRTAPAPLAAHAGFVRSVSTAGDRAALIAR